MPTSNTIVPVEEGEILLIDKPLGWTSFDVVKRIRWSFDLEKVGHAGTLDPKATGLLIVCTGKKTKAIGRFVGLEKEYIGTLELGIRTPSHDTETEVTEQRPFGDVTMEKLRTAVEKFLGKQLQKPPMYSAVKYGGKPLYKYARKGRSVEREPKEVEVCEFAITGFEPPRADFRIVCSKGTYVRTLVDDLGQKLGCGATLLALRRTRIGQYHVSQAMTVEQLENTRGATVVNHSGVAHERRSHA